MARMDYPRMGTNDRFTLYTRCMTDSHWWLAKSKCAGLSPDKADKMFFPGRGGSTKKAETFCNGCPVVGICLRNAIEKDLEGFYAGTTKAQRIVMAGMMKIAINPIRIPEPSKKRRVYRKVINTVVVHDEWLDKVLGPSEEELTPA